MSQLTRSARRRRPREVVEVTLLVVALLPRERASRGVRAAWAYHTIHQYSVACLGALATAHVVERGVAETVVYLKLICQSLKYIRGSR